MKKTKTKKGLVSVIFPTMNRKDDLIKCIQSIKNSTYKKIEIIIADNGSIDGSQQAVKKMFPDITLIENKRNLGVTIALNKCIRKSKGEFVYTLDDDTIIEKHAIEKMVKILKNDPKIGAVSCLYFFTEEPHILRTSGLSVNLFTGKTKSYGSDTIYKGQFDNKVLKRDAVGTHLTKREIYDEIGLYSEEYFLIYEDVDWCKRLKNAGYEIVVLGSTYLYHKRGGGLSQKNNPFRVYLANRNKTLYMKKYAGWKNLFFIPYTLFFVYPLKALNFLRTLNFKAIIALTKGIFDALFKKKEIFIFNGNKKIPYYKKQ